MKAVLIAVLLTAGCGWPAVAMRPAAAASGHPDGARDAIEALALRADELRVDSLGQGAIGDVTGVVAGPAADLLRRNSLRGRHLQEHFEVAVYTRSVVHWASATDQATAVVATSGRQRLVTSANVSAWDNFADQWQYGVRWSGGWHVWSAIELPPAEWWPA